MANLFDRPKLTEEDKALLESFQKRRLLIQCFIDKNGLDLVVCPGCGFPTFSEDWFHDICDVCNWQHDGQDDPDADKIWGGPNGSLSLTENRLNIGRELSKRSKELSGLIKERPHEIIEALEKHEKRMSVFNDGKMINVPIDAPIWKEWKKASKEILNDLIKI